MRPYRGNEDPCRPKVPNIAEVAEVADKQVSRGSGPLGVLVDPAVVHRSVTRRAPGRQ